MAKDSIRSLDKPEKLQDLLKEDRGDDCLSCRIVGESLLFVAYLTLKDPPLTCTPRRRRVPRPRRVQLHLGPVAARAAAGQDPGQRLALRPAQPQHGHHGHLARPGLAGRLAAGQMRVCCLKEMWISFDSPSPLRFVQWRGLLGWAGTPDDRCRVALVRAENGSRHR